MSLTSIKVIKVWEEGSKAEEMSPEQWDSVYATLKSSFGELSSEEKVDENCTKYYWGDEVWYVVR